jgi:transposase-like protein
MHTPDSEIQMPLAGRRHRRYSDEFKRQVIAACLEPGVSKAAVALVNGLNANLARRWVAEASQRSPTQLSRAGAPALAAPRPDAGFIPVTFEAPAPVPQADIRIELQHASTSVCIHWPLQASGQCAQWLREVLA